MSLRSILFATWSLPSKRQRPDRVCQPRTLFLRTLGTILYIAADMAGRRLESDSMMNPNLGSRRHMAEERWSACGRNPGRRHRVSKSGRTWQHECAALTRLLCCESSAAAHGDRISIERRHRRYAIWRPPLGFKIAQVPSRLSSSPGIGTHNGSQEGPIQAGHGWVTSGYSLQYIGEQN